MTIQPFGSVFNDKKTVQIETPLAPINLSKNQDTTELALLADPRTLRELIITAIIDSQPKDIVIIQYINFTSDLRPAENDGTPTTYQQAMDFIKTKIASEK